MTLTEFWAVAINAANLVIQVVALIIATALGTLDVFWALWYVLFAGWSLFWLFHFFPRN